MICAIHQIGRKLRNQCNTFTHMSTSVCVRAKVSRKITNQYQKSINDKQKQKQLRPFMAPHVYKRLQICVYSLTYVCVSK